MDSSYPSGEAHLDLRGIRCSKEDTPMAYHRCNPEAMLHDVWQAETNAEAEKAFDLFVATWGGE